MRLTIPRFSLSHDRFQAVDSPKYLIFSTRQFELPLDRPATFAVDLAVKKIGGEPGDYRRGMAAFVQRKHAGGSAADGEHAFAHVEVEDVEAQDKWIFGICHGIQVLISAGLARDRVMTAYEHIRYEIEAGGGTYSTQQAVRHGKLVTAQTWQSHPEFYRELFRCLAAAQGELVVG